ncbi:MAG: SDR family oxidoreductase [Clostridiales bacterium]|nr:SDR family oxidoreductase [Clostridiales bacterium]
MRYSKLLEGKSAWITGGSAPPFDAYALLFTKHGARVTVLDCEKGCDLTEPDAAGAACEALLSESGPPDIWLHIADVYDTAYIDELSMETLEKMLAVSVLTPFRIMKSIAVPMRENGGGSVVFVSGEYGVQAMNRVSAYGAAKGGEIAMANAFAVEYAADGIRVNTLVPGVSFSPVGDDILLQSGESDTPDFWGCVQPFRRRGDMSELANAALFLASDMSDYITGEALYINGAEHLIAHNHGFPRKDKVMP